MGEGRRMRLRYFHTKILSGDVWSKGMNKWRGEDQGGLYQTLGKDQEQNARLPRRTPQGQELPAQKEATGIPGTYSTYVIAWQG